MTTVFIAGSISIKRLDASVKDRIDTIVASEFDVVVGDAKGVDSMVQAHLLEAGAKNVRIYCTGKRPRNNLGGWPVETVTSKASPGTREYYTAKDLRMAENADFGLMIWDRKSQGTLSNVLELNRRSKRSVVFIAPEKRFLNVVDRDTIEVLTNMVDRDTAAESNLEKPHRRRSKNQTAQTTMDL